MLGTMLEMKAADVYLLTAETINGSVGKYEVPSNHQLAQNTLSAGESGEPVAQSATDVEPGYYLVGNFFSQYNKGGEYNPGGDGATINYTNSLLRTLFPQEKAVSLLHSLQQMSNRVTISWAISSRNIIKVENIIREATAQR